MCPIIFVLPFIELTRILFELYSLVKFVYFMCDLVYEYVCVCLCCIVRHWLTRHDIVKGDIGQSHRACNRYVLYVPFSRTYTQCMSFMGTMKKKCYITTYEIYMYRGANVYYSTASYLPKCAICMWPASYATA